jgi:hypothetical protein
LPHAVTAAFNNTYGYDDNGNQTTRVISGTTYTLQYDYENRLTAVLDGIAIVGEFVYDVDGQRVVGILSRLQYLGKGRCRSQRPFLLWSKVALI